MRDWQCYDVLCRQHLLGNHKELHMAYGSLKLGRSIKGHIDKGQLDAQSIKQSHDLVVAEMIKRGYNHYSPMPKLPVAWTRQYSTACIDTGENLKELSRRCELCKANILEAKE